ncbi:hypothetical protein [Denitratisoma oestradiolicum]|uniref:SPOR domain-containing protein n=1 Tax=Denitratisoma oestradiolicum TaxID=311182 RepID=A0A6S6Y0Y3_9PROT|nr:hypothetical protein [Denitratisoma oestradiolicum]CAB1371060.1 conserved protein of unknown function [Denitratisoma oestradiolicum]
MAALRLACLLLVLANLLFFVWSQGYLGSTTSGREPLRLSAQLVPEKLRLVAPEQLREICRLASGLRTDQGEHLLADWKARLPEAIFKLVTLEGAPMYQVAIPGLPSRAVAESKLAEVRALGVRSEVSFVSPSPDQVALIFATFRNEAGAREYLTGLERRGIRSARLLLQHSIATEAQIEIRGPAALQDRLPDLLAGVSDLTLTECATP